MPKPKREIPRPSRKIHCPTVEALQIDAKGIQEFMMARGHNSCTRLRTIVDKLDADAAKQRRLDAWPLPSQ